MFLNTRCDPSNEAFLVPRIVQTPLFEGSDEANEQTKGVNVFCGIVQRDRDGQERVDDGMPLRAGLNVHAKTLHMFKKGLGVEGVEAGDTKPLLFVIDARSTGEGRCSPSLPHLPHTHNLAMPDEMRSDEVSVD